MVVEGSLVGVVVAPVFTWSGRIVSQRTLSTENRASGFEDCIWRCTNPVAVLVAPVVERSCTRKMSEVASVPPVSEPVVVRVRNH